ncbi:hypothetical protein AAFF_G00117990 [Aldrovandia affinis]|uniref:Uncharacterized protein n=1 Tax=Aldrovandia affinis TaxID=143900 RepID=A0AAD7WA53_9TELE|nr:hypothetical protein AAFF_G00117990 [Aldrovandia affinis]
MERRLSTGLQLCPAQLANQAPPLQFSGTPMPQSHDLQSLSDGEDGLSPAATSVPRSPAIHPVPVRGGHEDAGVPAKAEPKEERSCQADSLPAAARVRAWEFP